MRSAREKTADATSTRPELRREDWRRQESRSLLDRVFGGKVAPLLAHFSQHEDLSAKDIAELRKLIDAIEKKGR